MGFKSTQAMQANTALSSLLAVKAGLRFKSPFPQILWKEFEQLQLARRVSAKDGGE
jgi:hypothetical protein